MCLQHLDSFYTQAGVQPNSLAMATLPDQGEKARWLVKTLIADIDLLAHG